jgi:hypothetical protein
MGGRIGRVTGPDPLGSHNEVEMRTPAETPVQESNQGVNAAKDCLGTSIANLHYLDGVTEHQSQAQVVVAEVMLRH